MDHLNDVAEAASKRIRESVYSIAPYHSDKTVATGDRKEPTSGNKEHKGATLSHNSAHSIAPFHSDQAIISQAHLEFPIARHKGRADDEKLNSIIRSISIPGKGEQWSGLHWGKFYSIKNLASKGSLWLDLKHPNAIKAEEIVSKSKREPNSMSQKWYLEFRYDGVCTIRNALSLYTAKNMNHGKPGESYYASVNKIVSGSDLVNAESKFYWSLVPVGNEPNLFKISPHSSSDHDLNLVLTTMNDKTEELWHEEQVILAHEVHDHSAAHDGEELKKWQHQLWAFVEVPAPFVM